MLAAEALCDTLFVTSDSRADSLSARYSGVSQQQLYYFERWMLTAGVYQQQSHCLVVGESAAVFEWFVAAVAMSDSRLVWCQKQANAQYV
jgi:hypothetical protein